MGFVFQSFNLVPTLTVIVTHDPAVAASTDRVIHMRDGLIEEATALALAA